MNLNALLVGICLYASAISCIEALHCWTCENANSVEECDRIGELRKCNPTQNTCGIEVRQNGGWQISSNVKVFKYCKQASACDNIQDQNSKKDWRSTQCNPKVPNSVCRCCCNEDACNMGDLKCLDVEEAPTCFPSLISPKDGLVMCSNKSNIGSQCSFSCLRGFYVNGVQTSTCQSNKRWTSAPPTCQPITCSALPNIDNGSFKCDRSTKLGSECRFTCDLGYKLVGSDVAECQENVKKSSALGRWSTSGQMCERAACRNNLRAPSYGYKSCTDRFNTGSVCEFSCHEDFDLVGPSSATCNNEQKWDAETPKCNKKECPNFPSIPANGTITCSHSNIINSICEFACNEEYDLIGSDVTACVHGYQDDVITTPHWSKEEPICQRKSCGLLPSTPKHGFMACTDGKLINSICEFTCYAGYNLIGHDITSCMFRDLSKDFIRWNNQEPYCERKECDALPQAPTNGNIYCSDGKFLQSVCQFGCEKEYDLMGSNTLLCLEHIDEDGGYMDGKGYMVEESPRWNEEEPICQRKICNYSPSAPSNGDIKCTDDDILGSVCTFRCDSAYYMEGESTTECMLDDYYTAYWSNEEPICKRKFCNNAPVAPDNGFISCTDGHFLRSVCEFSCDPVYYRAGYQYSTCLENDRLSWDNEEPVCIRKECSSLPAAPSHSTIECSDEKFLNSVCNFECSYEYNLVGPEHITCQEDYINAEPEWSQEEPTCIRKECAVIPSIPDHGNMKCSDEKFYDSVCTFTCHEQYELDGYSYVMCGSMNAEEAQPTWDFESPVCKRLNCMGKPTAPTNGFIVCTDADFIGSECEYGCDAHYRRVGPLHTTCEDSGYGYMEWSQQEEAVCERITCPKLDRIRHGNMKCSDEGFVNSECEFSCTVEDYNLSPIDRHSITCQNDTTWSNTPPCCARSCPPYAVMDLVVILDSSSSIGAPAWKIMLKFVNDIFELFRVKRDATNFGVVRYNKRIDRDTQINLNECPDDVEMLKDLVAKIPYNGAGTWTGQAIKYVHEHMLVPEYGNRPHAADVVLVITDGRSQDDVKTPSYALREAGVLTYALGITPINGKLDMDQLLDIAGSETNLLLAEDGFGTLTPEFAKEISRQICGDPCQRPLY